MLQDSFLVLPQVPWHLLITYVNARGRCLRLGVGCGRHWAIIPTISGIRQRCFHVASCRRYHTYDTLGCYSETFRLRRSQLESILCKVFQGSYSALDVWVCHPIWTGRVWSRNGGQSYVVGSMPLPKHNHGLWPYKITTKKNQKWWGKGKRKSEEVNWWRTRNISSIFRLIKFRLQKVNINNSNYGSYQDKSFTKSWGSRYSKFLQFFVSVTLQ